MCRCFFVFDLGESFGFAAFCFFAPCFGVHPQAELTVFCMLDALFEEFFATPHILERIALAFALSAGLLQRVG